MNKIKISFWLNITIFFLVTLASIIMVTGFHFMRDNTIFDATGLKAIRFFTVDSNILMGLMALIMAKREHALMKQNEEIPKKIYVLKLISTSAVALTFLVTVLYLAPIIETGYFSLFQNSNLFFHLIIPVLSIITFIFFEKTDKIELKNVLYSLIPTFIYAILYVINILLHLENGKISYDYDWYGFAQNGIVITIIVFILVHVITYVICLIIWFLNRRWLTR